MSINRLNIFALITFMLSLVHLTGAHKANAFVHEPDSAMFNRASDKAISYILNPEIEEEVPEFKSKSLARLHSVAFTTIPLALARLNSRGYRLPEQSGTSILLIIPAVIVGPSAGSIYSDDWPLARRSIIIRSSTFSMLVSGYFIRQNEDFEALGLSLLVSSGLLLAFHSLYDIIFLSSHSVDYYNARIRMETGLTIHNLIPQEWEQMSAHQAQKNVNPLPSLNIRLFF